LRYIFAESDFIKGIYDTSFVPKKIGKFKEGEIPSKSDLARVVAAYLLSEYNGINSSESSSTASKPDVWSEISNFRLI